MDLSAEVLTYIQTVKSFLKKNEQANAYFLTNVDENLFYEHLGEIAEKNFKKFGDPTLNREQFDILRKTIIAISIANNPIKEEHNDTSVIPHPSGIFINIPNFGEICLN